MWKVWISDVDKGLARRATVGGGKHGSPPVKAGSLSDLGWSEPYSTSPCNGAQDADVHTSPAPGKASSGFTPERRSTAHPRPRETRPVGARHPGAEAYGVTADLGPASEQVLSDGEERQTHTAPPPGNGGRVPHSGSASGSALSEGTSVRVRSRTYDDEGEMLEPDELGMVIGFEGDLVVVSFSQGRTAAVSPSDLRAVPPRIGR